MLHAFLPLIGRLHLNQLLSQETQTAVPFLSHHDQRGIRLP